MAGLLVGDTVFDEIRAALDVALSQDDIPDQVIDLGIYRGRAERAVLTRDPLAATRTGTDAERVRDAAICFCAAYLAPAVAQRKQETLDGGDYSYQAERAKWSEREAALLARAEEELALVLHPGDPGDTSADLRPTMFAAACGRRGY